MEVTCRTLQGRFLLLPTGDLPRIVIGILARAVERYPLRIHAFAFLSNHFHLLVSPESAHQLADFMRYLNTNLSKEAGRVHGWEGSLLQRRYQAIPISSEERVQVSRLRYVLSQGCKEGLVSRPSDWPGAHCADSLRKGTGLRGVWFDRTQEWKARRRRSESNPDDFATEYLLELDPLPCWQAMTSEGYRERVGDLIRQIEIETEALHRRRGTRPLGVSAVMSQSPHNRPRVLAKRPAPLVHAAARRVRQEFLTAYRSFVTSFRRAAERLRSGDPRAEFPAGSFLPPMRLAHHDVRGAPD